MKLNPFKKTLDNTTIQKYVQDFRKKNIPERYNQIKLVEYLTDEEVDHYISISNRSDGKSFNYMDFFITFCIDHKDVGFMFLVRHHTLQQFGVALIKKIIDKSNNNYNLNDFAFTRNDFYNTVIYKDKIIGIITDLNKASDLKLNSNFLLDFSILIYDEFLALEGDYLPDEWDKLATIYSTVNRVEGGIIPYIKVPKVFYFGNAVNFSSPVLSNLNIYNILEAHKINTIKKYGNKVLEFNKNENANEERNLRAFGEQNDPMTHGQFKMNKHNILDDYNKKLIMKNPDYIYVKLDETNLKITYNRDNYNCYLSLQPNIESYDYNYLLKDNTRESIFLNDTYYDEYHIKKYDNDLFMFDNVYTKEYILSETNNLYMIKINKLIREHFSKNINETNFNRREKNYEEVYIENTKKAIFKKFFQ